MSMTHANCPVCDFAVSPEPDVVPSEVITCPDCGTELEVKSIDPFTLAEAPAVEEDWGE